MKVLIVDDDQIFLEQTKLYLEREDQRLDITTVTSGEECLKELREHSYDAVVSDYKMPGMNGLELLEQVKNRSKDILFILFTGKSREKVAVKALNQGADRYLRKGTDPSQYKVLANTLIKEVQHYRTKKQKELFRFGAANAPEEIFIVNKTGEVIYANKGAVEKLGYTKHELESMRVFDIDPQYSPENWEKHWQQTKRENKIRRESSHIRKDGTSIPVELLVNHLTFGGEEYHITFARDISEQKKREQELREVREKYQGLFNNLNDAVFVHDLEGNFLTVNDTAVERLGYSREEFLSMSPHEIDVSKYAKKVGDRINTLEETESLTFETVHVTKTGNTIPVEISSSLINFHGEKAILSVARDITKRKKFENKLKSERDRARKYLNIAGSIIMALNTDFEVTLINQAGCNILGREKKEIIGENWLETFVPERNRKTVQETFKKLIQEEIKPVEYFENSIRTKSGEERIIRWHNNVLKNEKDEVIGTLSSGDDITELKEMQQNLETLHKWAQKLNQSETLNNLFTYTLNAVEECVGDIKLVIGLLNSDILKIERSKDITLSKEQQTIRFHNHNIFKEVVHSEDSLLVPNITKSPTYSPLNSESESVFTVPIQTNSEISGILHLESEEIAGFSLRDQTLLEILASHMAVAMKELWEKKRRVSLERIDELRNQFLAMAAHEINTPLTPIRAGLEMLLKSYHGELTNPQEKQVKNILESVERLDHLVEDFQEISNLRSKKIELEKERKKYLVNTLEQVLKNYKYVIPEKGIILIKKIPRPLRATYDEERMIQVIQNLVENAIDYTEDKIWVKGKEYEDRVCLSIKDNGIGIPEDKQEKIFKPFYRVEHDRERINRDFGGTGLGLNICKRIIKSHGGNIQVESTPGEGSTFTICLPKKRTRTPLNFDEHTRSLSLERE